MSGSDSRASRKPPRKATSTWMRRSALHYLQRYPTTRAHLRRVMRRRIQRSVAHHGGELSEVLAVLDELLGELQQEGWLDDQAYVRARVDELFRRGASMRAIRGKLREKGAPQAAVDEALALLREEQADPELVSAIAYARRRRLGPFRKGGSTSDRSSRQKELASLGRAGFPLGVARKIIEAASVEDLDEQLE